MGDQGTRVIHVIGLTGSFGSGCSYIAEHIISGRGYRRISLSDILRQFHGQAGNNCGRADRHSLQDFGDSIRADRGRDCLAQKAIEQITSDQSTDKWVVDSIRNPHEIHALRAAFPRFFLFGVFANESTRWGRVCDIYKRDRKKFEEDDTNDKGERSDEHGQRVGDCFYESDVVISNDSDVAVVDNEEFAGLAGRVGRYVGLVENPLTKQQPQREEEAIMAMAYAASQRSSCMKRKVGAVIVDQTGAVISSGYNEVPSHERSCFGQYKMCHRDYLCDQFFAKLKESVPDVEGKERELRAQFRGHFKMLDYCRALHAEENAIVALARNGRSVPLSECSLYTTTYPCRMCANKIVNAGIRRIVYLEPYPDPEAKVILKNANVREDFFEGITYRAYFRVYGEER